MLEDFNASSKIKNGVFKSIWFIYLFIFLLYEIQESYGCYVYNIPSEHGQHFRTKPTLKI